jgi:hypothetical protein
MTNRCSRNLFKKIIHNLRVQYMLRDSLQPAHSDYQRFIGAKSLKLHRFVANNLRHSQRSPNFNQDNLRMGSKRVNFELKIYKG